MGLWLSRDPSGEGSGLNLYAYVGNNPISFTDRLGLFDGVYSPYGPGTMLKRPKPQPLPANFSASNPTGHGFILFDGGGGYYNLFGGGGGVQTLLLDNGQLVTYSYEAVGIGFGKGGGNMGMGEVNGVFSPLDYSGAFISVNFSFFGAATFSYSPSLLWSDNGATSYSCGGSTPGINASFQVYQPLSATDPIGQASAYYSLPSFDSSPSLSPNLSFVNNSGP